MKLYNCIVWRYIFMVRVGFVLLINCYLTANKSQFQYTPRPHVKLLVVWIGGHTSTEMLLLNPIVSQPPLLIQKHTISAEKHCMVLLFIEAGDLAERCAGAAGKKKHLKGGPAPGKRSGISQHHCCGTVQFSVPRPRCRDTDTLSLPAEGHCTSTLMH